MQAARGTPLTPSEPADSPPPEGRVRPRLLFAVVALAAYLLDIGTKILAVRHLTDRPDVQVVGEWLQLTLVRNPGAAFSTGTRFTVALSVLAMVAIGVVLYLSRRIGSRAWAVALGLLLAGVAGNFTDRVFRAPGFLQGHVVDFFRLPNWPVFNVADICIDIGVALILVLTFRGIGLDGSRHRESEGPA